ncbi:hypothetical protein Pmar_PMAR022021 [Perkinsus marinus ATCC 50983]|uniref:Uncharacterized protein n=1 Tax=Perkinsus marinus (strain ATCC 50983 / TXsc) TaxID=423536 RepID=C5L629_PERM5|nr:hypothetical protein Pmar_PMAR022021 [Perkinsus marinus ATCC 50983]EER07814.1 hypothetical protein Pmar_PMAR022021 [Perkinsus marinus ATCC 50983]|eukprot:XP_002775998.1 hypothetical protein Pmar_PMAR022021 [Perkinsus marinus ATCC 50983]
MRRGMFNQFEQEVMRLTLVKGSTFVPEVWTSLSPELRLFIVTGETVFPDAKPGQELTVEMMLDVTSQWENTENYPILLPLKIPAEDSNRLEGHTFDTIAQQAWKRYESEMSYIETESPEDKCFYRALTVAETRFCRVRDGEEEAYPMDGSAMAIPWETKGDHDETLQEIARDPKNGYVDSATKEPTRVVDEATAATTASNDAKVTTPQVDVTGNDGSSSKWDKNWYGSSSKWSGEWYDTTGSASKYKVNWYETPQLEGKVLLQPVCDSPPTVTNDEEAQGGSSCSKSVFLSDVMKSTYEGGSVEVKSSEKGKKKKSKGSKDEGSSSSSSSSSSSIESILLLEELEELNTIDE